MANEDEKLIKVTLVNNTKAAINAMKGDFLAMQKELAAGIETLADGTKVNTNVLKQYAKDQNISYNSMLQHINSVAAGQKALGGTITNTVSAGQGLRATLGGLSNALGTTAAGLAVMGVKAVGAYKAFQMAKEGFIGYGQFETKLRLVQNQTNMTRGAIDGLGQSMKALQEVTGVAKEELLAAFEELREAGNLTPEQTMKIIPTMSKIAIGAGANVKAFGRTLGDIMRNMKVPADQANHIMEAMSHAAKEYNINLDEVGPNLSRLTEMAQQWGYTGVDGAQRLITILGTTKEAIGDAGKSAMLLTRLLGDVGSNDALGKALGKAPGQLYKELKAISELPGGDVIGALTGMLIAADDKEAVMKVLGVNDTLVLRKLMAEWTNLGDKIRATQNAYGGVARGENVLKSPEMAVKRLNNAVTDLQQAIGMLLDMIGATTVLNRFAKEIYGIAAGLEKIVLLMSWVTGGERPAGLAKSWEEAWYNATTKRDENDRPIVPFDEAQAMKRAGKNPADVEAEWESKQQRDTRRGELDVKRRVLDAEKARRDELRKKYGEGSVLEPGTTPEPPKTRRPSIFLPPALEKMSLAIDDVNEKLVEFAKTLPDDDNRRAIIMKAGLYNYGAGPAGTGAPGESPATYGGSADAKYLKAAYTPSGGGYFGGTTGPGGGGHGPGGTGSGRAGPGGSGTSYGPQPGGLPHTGGTPGRGGTPPAPGTQAPDLTPGQKAFLDTISQKGIEGAGYNTIVGGKTFSDYSQHPNIVGYTGPHGKSTAAGRYQFTKTTWDEAQKALGLPDFSPASQDKAAIWLARRDYKRRTGRDFDTDADAASKGDREAAESLRRGLGGRGANTTWEGLQRVGPGDFASRLERSRKDQDQPPATAGKPGEGDPADNPNAFGGVKEQQQNAGRSGALNEETRRIMDEAGKAAGVEARVFSGDEVHGKFESGSGRHKGGRTADFILYDQNGNKIPSDDPRALRYVEEAAKRGMNSGGANYMKGDSQYKIDMGTATGRRGSQGAYAGNPAFRAAFERGLAQRKQYLAERAARIREAAKAGKTPPVAGATPPATPATPAPTVPPIDTGARPDMTNATLNPVDRGGNYNGNMYVNVVTSVNDAQVRFARNTIRREVDSQTRMARHNGYSDITTA